ncbi:hypothetical protein ACROYT_G036861 [Oculina patagonica]
MAGICDFAHCEHGASRKESLEHVYKQQETLDRPSDITLVVKDGKEFKAHKDVLSEASPYFEKMLNSDMKESKEEVVRLEMFSESVIAATLEFIYTGSVQILTQEMAEGLIVIADYLSLPRLKIQAEEIVMDELDATNCISSFYFAERYQCEELVLKARQFIVANFSALSKTEEFLNMPSKEVEMWISSDDIDVTAEEDVFKIILAWIKHGKSKRKKYFAELFRHVRLGYVSRDFLRRNVVTNNLVKDNEGCLDLVKDAIDLIDSKNYHNLFVRPRKSLETAVIAFMISTGNHILGYLPRKDKFCMLGEIPCDGGVEFFETLVSCYGKLYCVRPSSLLCYDPFSNTWRALPYTDERNVRQIFVRNENEMYALMFNPLDGMLHLTKYKPESSSWENVSLLECEMVPLSFQERMCIVTKDSFIYFIGGRNTQPIYPMQRILKDVYRYDLDKDQVDKLANLQVERDSACGALVHGKIFVAGGTRQYGTWSKTCEVYDETTNQWHFIGSGMTLTRMPPYARPSCKILSADDKLYSVFCLHENDSPEARIKCYDPEKDEWNEAAKIPLQVDAGKEARSRHLGYPVRVNACPMRVFKGFLSNASVILKCLLQ